MRYWPVSSVTTDRTFSMSAGLDASTVTPGSTAPEASLTRPVIDACARAIDGNDNNDKHTTRNRLAPRIAGLLLIWVRHGEAGEALRAGLTSLLSIRDPCPARRAEHTLRTKAEDCQSRHSRKMVDGGSD